MTNGQGIRMSESITNIAPALHNIQKELKPIEKRGKNEAQKYAYAKFEDYVEGIKDILGKEGLTIITTVKEPQRLEPRPTKYGGFQYVVQVAIVARLFHSSGEWIEIDCYGEGQDTGDKAIYKAITGARKYALACLLGLGTTDDPEKDDDQQKQQQGNKNSSNQQRPAQNQGQKQSNQANQQPPVAKGKPEEIERTFSSGVDLINASENMDELKTAFSKSWTNLKKLTYENHPKMKALASVYQARKKQFNN